MDPSHPLMSGVVQNQDTYMKGKIAQRYFYDRVKPALAGRDGEYYRHTGRRYDMVESYRMDDAEYAIVGMGGMVETAAVTCDYLREQTGVKVGVVHVTVFRPFPGPELVAALSGLRAFTVLERMDNPLGQSNPLTTEIKAAFADALSDAPGYPRVHRLPVIYSGSAGLGSRDVRPGDFIAVVKNMVNGGQRYFALGIKHALALEAAVDPDVRPKSAFSMRGHSVGGFGSVTTNKVIATIVGDLFDLYVQAYPKYGSEKKGLPTTYYLTVADEPIRTHCELNFVEGVGDNEAAQRARAAVDSRAFPLLVYDPRKGDTFRERLDLKGNPNVKDDWYVNPKTKEQITFVDFARGEGRFAKHFDAEGKPSEMILAAKAERLRNWRLLQDLAGVREPTGK